jgi:hypothetical protein
MPEDKSESPRKFTMKSRQSKKKKPKTDKKKSKPIPNTDVDTGLNSVAKFFFIQSIISGLATAIRDQM